MNRIARYIGTRSSSFYAMVSYIKKNEYEEERKKGNGYFINTIPFLKQRDKKI